jgi:hypothetical protein
MRDQLIQHLNDQNLGEFLLSRELPWASSGTPLYVKNAKKIYVDLEQTTNDPLIGTLDGLVITNTVNVVRLYFSNDAKILPAGYNDAISVLKNAKDTDLITGAQRRECLISTEFIEDLLVTTVEYRFTKLT